MEQIVEIITKANLIIWLRSCKKVGRGWNVLAFATGGKQNGRPGISNIEIRYSAVLKKQTVEQKFS